MRLGIPRIELQRLRQGSNRFRNLSLCELAVTESIPTPRGFRTLFDVIGQEGLNVLKTAGSNVGFEIGNFRGIVNGGCFRERLEAVLRGEIAWVELQGLPVSDSSVLDVSLLLKNRT